MNRQRRKQLQNALLFTEVDNAYIQSGHTVTSINSIPSGSGWMSKEEAFKLCAENNDCKGVTAMKKYKRNDLYFHFKTLNDTVNDKSKN